MQDPFGGIKGREIEHMSGFAIDKEEALRELQQSIDLLDKKKIVKKTFLEKLRQKNQVLKIMMKVLNTGISCQALMMSLPK